MSDLTNKEELFLNRARARCSRMELCPAQIRRSLSKQLDSEAVERIITKLEQEKFIDSMRFANSYVRDKSRFSAWGPKKIEYNLRGLNIDKEIINRAIKENYSCFNEENKESLEKLIFKKWESLKREEDLDKKRSKTLRFAVGRGFYYDDICSIMETLINKK